MQSNNLQPGFPGNRDRPKPACVKRSGTVRSCHTMVRLLPSSHPKLRSKPGLTFGRAGAEYLALMLGSTFGTTWSCVGKCPRYRRRTLFGQSLSSTPLKPTTWSFCPTLRTLMMTRQAHACLMHPQLAVPKAYVWAGCLQKHCRLGSGSNFPGTCQQCVDASTSSICLQRLSFARQHCF